MVVPLEDVVVEGFKLWNYSFIGQSMEHRLLIEVISLLIVKAWGRVEVSLINVLKDDLVLFQCKKDEARA